MLGQVSQVNGNIQNNTSIKSQDTVPQATSHQTPPNILKSFESTPTFEQLKKSGRREHLTFSEEVFDDTLFRNKCVHVTCGINPK